MDLARSLGAPVPKVLRYNCTHYNAVGQPFIAFSDPGGSAISNLWMDIDDRERLKLGDVAADLLAKLSAVEFPAYGNIYYTRDLPEDCKSYPIPDRGELKGLCVGPFCAPQYEPTYFERSRRPQNNSRIFTLNTAAELARKKNEGSYVSPLTHPDEVERFNNGRPEAGG
ncbi:putative phosphotransferase enzyme family protein [Diplodia seriata]|uniref:Putative phosphotransferase enzyme family protein n=1 Tax=Diplodia seriata TaxID=420778 RepID=A0A0G2DSX1_9PEZI|nr:putative phosphotransferase enzyme family protein [Diplodia seriata]